MNLVTCSNRRGHLLGTMQQIVLYCVYTMHMSVYVCATVCACSSVHQFTCVCMNLYVFMCVCGPCVLKSENNKQRSQTVILHKRPVPFFSLSLSR